MIKPNACPYCGGKYTLAETCSGPRSRDPKANTCREMALRRQLVAAAANEDEGR